MPGTSLKPTRQFVLASSSPYRKKVLGQVLEHFICQSPDIDETPLAGESPSALARRLAQSKAQRIARHHRNAVVIGSDQIAVLDGHILSKPGGFTAAREQLTRCAGRKVNFLTGLCVIRTDTGYNQTVVEPFSVHFRQLTEREIDSYLRRDRPYDCAGAFKMESLGIALFCALEGRDPNTLIGLPLIALCDMLRDADINPLLLQHEQL